LETLGKAGVRSVGAGANLKQAENPEVVEIDGKGRVVLLSFGSETSGIPVSWAASEEKPGLNLLKDLSDETVQDIRRKVQQVKQRGGIVVSSIHWGANWGYDIPGAQIEFAHKLVDHAGVDVVYGHSSHHVKGIEVYKDKLVLYGCGDFLNDYEGISGHEAFRCDLGLMYFATIDPLTGKLAHLQMTPTQVKRFRVNRASTIDALWLSDVLNREGTAFETQVKAERNGTLMLQWH
jgi:poly-gamma-glutamate synthesis protein (capsule biosynthesis protein)